jgi:hypothetical protein
MVRLTPEQAERIHTKALASLDEPNPVADVLTERLLRACEGREELERQLVSSDERNAAYLEEISFLRIWVSFLERTCRLAGIDPTDLG